MDKSHPKTLDPEDTGCIFFPEFGIRLQNYEELMPEDHDQNS
jgi:hypothetical protein